MGSRRVDFGADTGGFHRIALDTNSCIYFLRSEAERWSLVDGLLKRAARSTLQIELSAIVQLELMVKPLKRGALGEMLEVMRFTEQAAGVSVQPITQRVIFAAAGVRAMTNMKTPDAIIVATAATGDCDAIIGNDVKFRQLNEMQSVLALGILPDRVSIPAYLHLDDYVK